jgi:hypothetical protein
MIKFYSRVIAIAIGTIAFGSFLLINNNNVVERVVLFPPGFSIIFGHAMILVSVIKLLSVFRHGLKLKRYALIAITLCWLTIGWAYVINGSQNTGFVMAFTLSTLCYIELWRGDYEDD